jgi:molecular chaperone HscB
MNYFELFEIPVQLKVNATALSKKFFELSRKYHPDYHAQSAGVMQTEALERSAMLNKAWKTFQDPQATIKYVLQWKGLLEEEEKFDLPSDFLMEVLELNEQLMELDQSAVDGQQSAVENRQSTVDGQQSAAAALKAEVTRLEKEIYEPVKEIVEHYEEGVTSGKELLQVKDYYFKKKYLDRIHRQLAGKA